MHTTPPLGLGQVDNDGDVAPTIKLEPAEYQLNTVHEDLRRRQNAPTSAASLKPTPIRMECNNDIKGRKISSGSSNASSDDVFESEPNSPTRPKAHHANIPPPPFESIKNQIKKNSVPDAKAIGQHIDRLISQNKAIIENWNQVSIRSYNSQAATATSEISSWTRDLLNYHLMNSCGSGRIAPPEQRAAGPLAFNFNQADGFDQMMSVAMRNQQPIDSAHLIAHPKPSSKVAVSMHQTPPPGEIMQCLDMTNHKKQEQQLKEKSDAIFQQTERSHFAKTDLSMSKTVSPARRRTCHEMEAPSRLQIPAHHQAHHQQQHVQQASLVQISNNNNNFETIQDNKQAPAPVQSVRAALDGREPSSELAARQQRLDELCILKQQLLTTPAQQQAPISNEPRGSNLPIKKRKISEPNMR